MCPKIGRGRIIKNNFKALLIHVVISIISLFVFMSFHTSAVKWASEEAARQHHISMVIVAIAVIIAALFLYYYFSKKYLCKQGSSFKNILSICITTLTGIALWLIAICIDLTGGTKILLNSELWQLYSLYYSYSLFLVDEIAVGNPYLMLVFCVLPATAMYYGIKKKES